MISISGAASRMALTRCTAMSICCADKIPVKSQSQPPCMLTPRGSTFKQLYPSASTRLATSAYSAGVTKFLLTGAQSNWTWLAYARILSRVLPPKSCQTGTPSHFPLMSHSAMSMALIPAKITAPPPCPQKVPRWRRSQICSMFLGSMPIMHFAKSTQIPNAA